MSAAEVIEELRHLSDAERLAIIEAATRMMRGEAALQADRLKRQAAALRDLYEPGGELTVWTALDAEEVVDEPEEG